MDSGGISEEDSRRMGENFARKDRRDLAAALARIEAMQESIDAKRELVDVQRLRIQELEAALREIMAIHWPDGHWYAVAETPLDSPAASQD